MSRAEGWICALTFLAGWARVSVYYGIGATTAATLAAAVVGMVWLTNNPPSR